MQQPNIIVDDSGRAQLADFGFSSVTDPIILELTDYLPAVSVGGTIQWQAPELLDPSSGELVPNSKKSDIYAWACVCYEVTHSFPLRPFSDISLDIFWLDAFF